MHQREEDYHLLDPMTAQLLYERIEREFSTTGVSAGDNDDFLAYDWLGHLFDDAQFRSPATSFGIVPGGPCLQGLPAQPDLAFTPSASLLGNQTSGFEPVWSQQPDFPVAGTSGVGTGYNPGAVTAPAYGYHQPLAVQTPFHLPANHAMPPANAVSSASTMGPPVPVPTMPLETQTLAMCPNIQQGGILRAADDETAGLLSEFLARTPIPVHDMSVGIEQGFVIPMDDDTSVDSPAGPALPRKRQKTSTDSIFDRSSVKTFVDKHTGVLQGEQAVYGRSQNARGSLTEEGRKSQQLTKKIGACPRCRRLKTKCDIGEASPYSPCLKCSSAKPRILTFVCCRSRVTEATFFRLKPMFQSPLDSTSREEVFLVQDIEAQDLDTRTLELTQDVGDLKLTVTVSRFTPRDTDKTALAWTDEQGQEHSFEMAPYCLNNVKQDVLNMRNYAFEARGPYIDSILANANDITRKFVAAAQQYISTKKNTLLEQAIELWTTTRLTERVWRICGNETLGMDPISDKTCPDFGIIPVTPIMDTQLDQIVIREILLPLRNRILYKLDGRLKEPKRDEWFENFLIIFILLSSIEACSVHGEKFAKEFGLRRRYADMEEFNSYFHSCRILLAHFHIALNGSTPLTIDWLSPKADKLAVLTLEQKRFLEAAKPMIAEEENKLRLLKTTHRYAAHLHWGHQLFYSGWEPGVMQIMDEIIQHQ